METVITTRFATLNDAPAIADISRQTFYETFAAENSAEDMQLFMEKQFSRELLEREVAEPGNTTILAFVNGALAGYALLRLGRFKDGLDSSHPCEIARIYSKKEFIGRGVGAVLMEKSLAFATANHCDVVWLGVWEKNERAIKFYSKWGFREFSKHTFMLGNDPQTDLLMNKVMI